MDVSPSYPESLNFEFYGVKGTTLQRRGGEARAVLVTVHGWLAFRVAHLL
jgi:hypothetical protein